MIVQELIDYLSKVNPDMEVLVDGYEGDYDHIGHIYHKVVKPNSNPAWYYGKLEEGTGEGSRLALVLSRH